MCELTKLVRAVPTVAWPVTCLAPTPTHACCVHPSLSLTTHERTTTKTVVYMDLSKVTTCIFISSRSPNPLGAEHLHGLLDGLAAHGTQRRSRLGQLLRTRLASQYRRVNDGTRSVPTLTASSAPGANQGCVPAGGELPRGEIAGIAGKKIGIGALPCRAGSDSALAVPCRQRLSTCRHCRRQCEPSCRKASGGLPYWLTGIKAVTGGSTQPGL
jgi:hypothetical protein